MHPRVAVGGLGGRIWLGVCGRAAIQWCEVVLGWAGRRRLDWALGFAACSKAVTPFGRSVSFVWVKLMLNAIHYYVNEQRRACQTTLDARAKVFVTNEHAIPYHIHRIERYAALYTLPLHVYITLYIYAVCTQHLLLACSTQYVYYI